MCFHISSSLRVKTLLRLRGWLLSLVYMFGLRISRLILAEIIMNYYDLKYIFGHINIYKEDATEIFKDLEMNMIICQFKWMFMLIENLRNLRPIQMVWISRICAIYTLRSFHSHFDDCARLLGLAYRGIQQYLKLSPLK